MKKTLFYFILLLFIILFAIIGIYLYLPTYIETKLAANIEQETGIEHIECKVRKLGLGQTDFSDISLGKEEAPTISIDSVRIDYTLLGLFNRHIDKIVLSGLEIRPIYKNGHFILPGFDFNTLISNKSDKSTPNNNSTFKMPITFGKCEFKRGLIIFTYENMIFNIPFNIQFVPNNKKCTSIKCIVNLYPKDQKITFSTDISIQDKKAKFLLISDTILLDKLTEFKKLNNNLNYSGEVNINTELDINFSPFSIKSLIGTYKFNNLKFQIGTLKLQTFNDPFSLVIRGSQDQFNLSSSKGGIETVSPFPVQFSNLESKIKMDKNNFDSSGSFDINLPGHYSQKNINRISLKYYAGIDNKENYKFEIEDTGKTRNIFVKFKDKNLKVGLSKINISGSGDKNQGNASYNIKIPALNFISNSAQSDVEMISGKGSMKYLVNDKSTSIKSSFEFKFINSNIITKLSKLLIPELSLNGEFIHNRNGVKFKVKSIIPELECKTEDHMASMSGINVTLPFKWPPDKSIPEGELSIDKISWNNKDIASLKSRILQQNLGINYKGELVSRILPDLSVEFNGFSGIDEQNQFCSDVEISIPDYKTTESVSLDKINPAAANMSFNGNIKIKVNPKLKSGIFKVPTEIHIIDSSIENSDHNFLFEGINLNLNFPDLLKFKTLPNQIFTFKKARFGDLSFEDGKTYFQIETLRSFFIEKGVYGWCNGHIYTQAMRFNPQKTEYKIFLFCDRISLAEVLTQFGLSYAEGKGTISGKIPIEIKNGELIFEDTLLYSTPGEEGVIRLSGADILMAGIPKGSVQYNQMDFSISALKDFKYQWVILKVSTKGKNCILNLSLNGKPSNPLPFKYNKKIGSYVKIKGKGGVLRSMKIDLNFKIPLNDIFYYKSGINKFIESLK